jgi:transcription initiation factor IIE alpha subunit
MKKCVFRISIGVLTVFFLSCNSETKKADNINHQSSKVQYQCPMKCSEQLFDKAGKCPECGMDLEEVSKS